MYIIEIDGGKIQIEYKLHEDRTVLILSITVSLRSRTVTV